MIHNFRKHLFSILSIALFLWGFALHAQKSQAAIVSKGYTKPQYDSRPIKVFLLAGQSNMGGKADGELLTKVDKKELAQASKHIQFYFNRGYHGPLKLTEAMKYDRENYNLKKSFGPEIFFGIEMAKIYPDDKLLFIKRSIGGTSLYGCWNPDWTAENAKVMDEEDEPKLYSDFQNYIQEVLKDYDPSEYEFAGMLWVQGEADSKVTTAAKAYNQNLQRLIEGMRNFTYEPELPFIIFQVGSGKVVEGMEAVAKRIKNVALIPQNKNPNSEDYYPEYAPPKSHYTYVGMKKIGQRFAKEYAGMSTTENE